MEPLLGQIQAFGFNFAPRGWAKCEGQLLQIAQNSALFSLLGTTYGGDGQTTFALPDLRGRVSLHFGQGPGLSSRVIGQRNGAENETLTVPQIPVHSHTLKAAEVVGTDFKPEANILAGGMPIFSSPPATKAMDASSIDNTGGGSAHNNMPPFLVINWCIALTGTFPSRN